MCGFMATNTKETVNTIPLHPTTIQITFCKPAQQKIRHAHSVRRLEPLIHQTIYNLKDKFECMGTVLDTLQSEHPDAIIPLEKTD